MTVLSSNHRDHIKSYLHSGDSLRRFINSSLSLTQNKLLGFTAIIPLMMVDTSEIS